MKQKVHHWNSHNNPPITEFIEQLIASGNQVRSLMATAYVDNQLIRAVIVTEQEGKGPLGNVITVHASATSQVNCRLISSVPRIAIHENSRIIYLCHQDDWAYKAFAY